MRINNKFYIKFYAMLLALVIGAGSFTPVFAAEETSSAPATMKRLVIGGFDITFNSNVIEGETLSGDMYTNTLKTTGNRRSIRLTWSRVANTAGIDGYIIVRKDSSGSRWRQIAKVGRYATSYTDRKAKSKKLTYSYTIVAYKNTSQGTRISNPAQWASAVTTRNKRKNVYSFKFTRPAMISALSPGETVSIKAGVRSKPINSKIRWSTSNRNVATVSSNGSIIGVAPGKVTLYGRTHTGRIFSMPVTVITPKTANGMLDVMRSWIGASYFNGRHKGIIDIYNSVPNLPYGYKMSYWDAWCAAAITSAAIKSRNAEAVGAECSVDRFVKIFRSKGIWIADNGHIPKPGDLIIYNWIADFTSNHYSHIGIVEAVNGNTITAIEGNMGLGKLDRRTIKVGWKYIKGYASISYTGGN